MAALLAIPALICASRFGLSRPSGACVLDHSINAADGMFGHASAFNLGQTGTPGGIRSFDINAYDVNVACGRGLRVGDYWQIKALRVPGGPGPCCTVVSMGVGGSATILDILASNW